MFGLSFNGFFSKTIEFFLTLLSSIIRIVILPINELIILTMPDLSEKIVEVSNNISTLFVNSTWALGVIPKSILVTLLFILSVEVARHTIYLSTHVFAMIWDLIRKLKFW